MYIEREQRDDSFDKLSHLIKGLVSDVKERGCIYCGYQGTEVLPHVEGINNLFFFSIECLGCAKIERASLSERQLMAVLRLLS